MINSRNKIILISAIVIILATAFIYFVNIDKEKFFPVPAQTVSAVPTTIPLAPTSYSYKKVIYNSWGTFKSADGRILSIESMTLTDSNGKLLEKNLKNPAISEKKFVLAADAMIVKPRGERQSIEDVSNFKAGDQLGFKTKAVPDESTGYEIITDLVILPPVPDDIINKKLLGK
jgi:hypothetical protein